ncbi:MAG: hypothetical protein LBF04_03175, partial [Prevotellaceae bacterium]|nr:hypothetical protein [Prevotellaceae bacterium]
NILFIFLQCFINLSLILFTYYLILLSKVTCGAATVFQVICRNPHVMHKEMWFLPSDAFLM